ncbi:MAG: AI-2E family transporter [Blastocatellia bacterium]|nr:AI-2E family transporter [Blastocatellia bacterium]MCS7158130.1 AI-2E family transporter [Blastocatellia bacterium]MCX7753007.1 AI-2E family transporter [Blastocatellia bacterium]MDW8168530.1 AI-2E family transporter [Acidobacteriota bacterium]MDW8256944.1 AI-2E family transporter [Acidobacteriota bacterium]
MKRETVQIAFLIALILGVGYLFFQMLAPFLSPIIWAIVLVIVFYPIHRRVIRLVRNADVAALLSSLLVLAVVIVPATLIVMALIGELIAAYRLVEERIASGAWTLRLESERGRILERSLSWLAQHADLSELNLRALILNNLQRLSSYLASRSAEVVRRFSSFVFDLGLMIFTMYFLFRDGAALMAKLKRAVPLPTSEAEEVFGRMQEMIQATLYGGVAVALAQGTLGGIAFWIVGLPSPTIWGATMFFFSFLPVVGAAIIWVPAAVVLIAQGSFGKGLFLLLWGTLVISTADNIIRPWVIGGRTRLPMLLIFFSVLGGVKVFGFIGVVVGPVILSVALTLVEIFRRKLTPAPEAPLQAS